MGLTKEENSELRSRVSLLTEDVESLERAVEAYQTARYQALYEVKKRQQRIERKDTRNANLKVAINKLKEKLLEATSGNEELQKELNKVYAMSAPEDPKESEDREERRRGWFTQLLGEKGDRHNIDIVTFCMTLMTKNISARASVAVIEAIVQFEASCIDAEIPEATRIPSDRRIGEWRHMLRDICHEVALRLLKTAKRWHLFHDGTTKKKFHLFGICARAEIPKGDDSGECDIFEFPIDVPLVPRSTAKAEADAIVKALTSRYVRAACLTPRTRTHTHAPVLLTTYHTCVPLSATHHPSSITAQASHQEVQGSKQVRVRGEDVRLPCQLRERHCGQCEPCPCGVETHRQVPERPHQEARGHPQARPRPREPRPGSQVVL